MHIHEQNVFHTTDGGWHATYLGVRPTTLVQTYALGTICIVISWDNIHA